MVETLRLFYTGPNRSHKYRKVTHVHLFADCYHWLTHRNQGEINFVWAGFLLQITSQMAECSKNLIGEVVMSGAGARCRHTLDRIGQPWIGTSRGAVSFIKINLFRMLLECCTMLYMFASNLGVGTTQQAVLNNVKA